MIQIYTRNISEYVALSIENSSVALIAHSGMKKRQKVHNFPSRKEAEDEMLRLQIWLSLHGFSPMMGLDDVAL